MFNRAGFIKNVCWASGRSFKDKSVKDVGGWIVGSLDEGMRPEAEMVWASG
jgi:hypothetical protein